MDRRSLLTGIGGLVAAHGCVLTTPDFGSKHLALPATVVGDAMAGAGADAASCPLGTWLHGTSIADEGLGDLLFVQTTVDLGDLTNDGGAPHSWVPQNLPMPSPCTNPISDLREMADLDDGVSAIGEASRELEDAGILAGSPFTNETMAAGSSSTMIRIVGYNGQADDDLVEVDLAQGACAYTGGCTPTPSWNGTDVWAPSVDYGEKVDAGYLPTTFATTRVAGWTFDVVLDSSRTLPVFRPIRFHATLVKGSDRWRLSGEATARVRPSDLLREGQVLGSCPGVGGSSFDVTKRTYCSKADLDTDGDGVCDSLSAAWTFQAEDARLGCMHQYTAAYVCADAASLECSP